MTRNQKRRAEKEQALPPQRVKELFFLAADDGLQQLRWRHTRQRAPAGAVAGSAKATGYMTVGVFGRYYAVHRLAFAYHKGRWPVGDIDHINGDKADNRIENLREATPQENSRNQRRRVDNISGVTGVYWFKPASRASGRWRAEIRAEGKRQFLGAFATQAEATAARKAAEIQHGYTEQRNAYRD